MNRKCNNNSEISPARRGQIVQRVLVEGWSPARAGAAFGIAERQVHRWVAAYRRFGMASLRGEGAVDYSASGWWRGLRQALARWCGDFRRGFGSDIPAACVELHHHRDDRRLR
ncbi:MAG TPA: helix-turn-helix domain-containing protein [Stellaceae bacterium]|nr:helix-turn-helix domain-containing protein [Stellaceae bacterium]